MLLALVTASQKKRGSFENFCHKVRGKGSDLKDSVNAATS